MGIAFLVGAGTSVVADGVKRYHPPTAHTVSAIGNSIIAAWASQRTGISPNDAFVYKEAIRTSGKHLGSHIKHIFSALKKSIK